MNSIIRLAGLIFILLILSGLIIPCQASNIYIEGNVTPNSGKEDTSFAYSAVIKFPGGSIVNPDINGALIIGLKISDNKVNKNYSLTGPFQGHGLSPEELIRGYSNEFRFGPYDLGHLGLKNIDDLSYEFVLTSASGKELARNKYSGPEIVIPPELVGSIQYSKNPSYYFKDFPITGTFKDKPNLIPSLQLSFRGPLNSSEERSWTEDLAANAVGTTYTFSKDVDFTQFRKGGKFSFNFTYDDFRQNEGYAPITQGPYYFTILPYEPKIVEPISLAKQIEYNNFSLKVFVEDEGMVLMGAPVGSSSSLVINHPTKGEMTFNNSAPALDGKYLVFEWDKSAVSFEKRDVLLSRKKPIQAHLVYWNDNRKYGANSSNYSFVLVNVTPVLTETHDSFLYITGSETVQEKIRAYVTYAKGMGDLKVSIVGPNGRNETILKGSPAGGNKYQYDLSLPLNRRQAGNYTITFAYIHGSLEGGSYEFEQKPEYSFQVVPILIEFQNGNVSPSHGRWNDSYFYSAEVNSSVEADAILQIFNPCSSEWTDAGGVKKIKPGASNISWMIQPFAYKCDGLDAGKYRFRANFLGKDFPSTIAYAGPKIINEEEVPRVYGHSLSPSEGTNNTTFNYNITLKFNKQGAIELQVFNPLYNQYDSRGQKSYTKQGENQTLTWVASYPQEYQGKELSYKFLYEGYPLVVDTGPRIRQTETLKPDMPRIYSSSLTPRSGTLNSTYNYTLTLSHNGSALIELQVAELEGRYKSRGSKLYDGSGRNSTLSWQVSNLSSQFLPDFEGTLRYRFLYQGEILESGSGPVILLEKKRLPENRTPEQKPSQNNTAPIIPTNVTKTEPTPPSGGNTSDEDFLAKVRKYHIGGGGGGISTDRFTSMLKELLPKIPSNLIPGVNSSSQESSSEVPVLAKTRVAPASGNWTDNFLYEADIYNKNSSRFTIGLEVYLPGSKTWETLDEKDIRASMYSKEHVALVSWKYNKFTPDDVGNASKYKIYYFDNSKQYLKDGNGKEELIGPINITKPKIYIFGQVAPKNGSCNQYYNYSFIVYHAAKARMKIGLEVFLPSVGDWYPLGEKTVYPSRYDNKNNATVYWYLKPFTQDDANKTSRFRVSYEDEKQNFGTIEWGGPMLVNHPPKIKEHKVEPANGTSMESFTYSAQVQDEDGDDVVVDLILYDPEKNSVLEKVRQTVRGIDAKNGTEVIWPYRFSETYSNKSIIYNITADDAVGVPIYTGNNSGPMLLSEPKIAVNVAGPVSSQNNNWWDTYTVKAMVKNPSPDEATVGIKFHTEDGIIDLKEPITVKQTPVAQECKWDFGKFTVKDRNRPIMYELTYDLADQNGRYSRVIEEAKPISDTIIPWPNVFFNAIWAILLGGFVFRYGSRLDGPIKKAKQIMRLSPAESAEKPQEKVGRGENQ